MKHTLRKVFATISAAAMCAIPTISSLSANAVAPENARFTFRRDYFVTQANLNLDRIIISWGLNSNGTSAPAAVKMRSEDTLQIGGGGAVNYHNGGGNFYTHANNRNRKYLAVTSHIYTNKTSLYDETGSAYAYTTTNANVSSKIYTTPSFIVGDLNGDKNVDGNDYSVILEAYNKKGYTSSFTKDDKVTFTLGNKTYNLKLYLLDINNDGRFTSADSSLLKYYNEHQNQPKPYKFPE